MTITNNVADSDNTGAPKGGGGIYNTATVFTMKNSVVGNNSAGAYAIGSDIRGSFYLSSYNHIGNPAYASLINANSTDTFGSPVLGVLQNNGGPTFTHLPASTSPRVNRIPSGSNGCGSTVTKDQRGQNRPYSAFCDKGAVETTF